MYIAKYKGWPLPKYEFKVKIHSELLLSKPEKEDNDVGSSKSADAKKVEFEEKLEDTLSNMSYKADDILVALEKKLEDLREKNAQLQK